MKDIIWKIKHIPSGLFYCTKKGRWHDSITNFSKKGNQYSSKKFAEISLDHAKKSASINKAQTERYDLDIMPYAFYYNKASPKDLIIVEYELVEIRKYEPE